MSVGDEVLSPFGNWLKEALGKRGMTMGDLSLQSGVDLVYLSRVARGQRPAPPPRVLRKLAGPLGVPYEELLSIAGHAPESASNPAGDERAGE